MRCPLAVCESRKDNWLPHRQPGCNLWLSVTTIGCLYAIKVSYRSWLSAGQLASLFLVIQRLLLVVTGEWTTSIVHTALLPPFWIAFWLGKVPTKTLQGIQLHGNLYKYSSYSSLMNVDKETPKLLLVHRLINSCFPQMQALIMVSCFIHGCSKTKQIFMV